MDVFTTDERLFDEERRRITAIARVDAHLPEQVFVAEFSNYAFIDLDDIFSKTFYEKITAFLRHIKEGELTLLVVEPDPKSYFYHHFGKYPLIKLPISSSSSEYVSAVFADPGGSPVDAIAYNSSVLLVHSASLRWGIYGSRDFEIGIFACTDRNLLDTFQLIYGSAFDAHAAIDNVLEPAWCQQFPSELSMQLLQNYSVI